MTYLSYETWKNKVCPVLTCIHIIACVGQFFARAKCSFQFSSFAWKCPWRIWSFLFASFPLETCVPKREGLFPHASLPSRSHQPLIWAEFSERPQAPSCIWVVCCGKQLKFSKYLTEFHYDWLKTPMIFAECWRLLSSDKGNKRIEILFYAWKSITNFTRVR